MDRASCPTCGSTVGVITADEGTSHYVPIEDDHQVCEAEIERLRAALRHILRGIQIDTAHLQAFVDDYADLAGKKT